MPDDQTDLVERIAKRDRGALRILVTEIGPVGLAVATRVTGSRELAEEALQDAFLDVWLKAGTFDPRKGKARQWVLTLIHHKAVDAVRREQAVSRTAREVPLPGEPPDPEERGWMSDRRDRVLKAIENISAAQREAIMLAYFGGLTYKQVADRLGIPEGTAKSRLRDGLITLRRLIEAHGVERGSA